MRILLVDDEKEFVSTLAERLSYRGIDADWTSQPEDAITMAETRQYDIAVLDVKMPRVNGLALKKRLQEKWPDMKCIFLTGHGAEEAFQAGALEAGEDYYLFKPVRLENLLAKIKEAGASLGREKNDD